MYTFAVGPENNRHPGGTPNSSATAPPGDLPRSHSLTRWALLSRVSNIISCYDKTDGDPGLAFGPRPGPDGSFSWSNGSRLYYSNLTSNFSASKRDETFKGVEGVAVSRTDNVQAAATGDASAWMNPVIASKQSSTTFSDKSQIWADNAASSPFFGHVYVCLASFRSLSRGLAAPQPW